jgi:Transposase IS200 like
MPHHITQRGNRRQQTFFNDGDYAAYLELMADWCREEGVEIWGYCLMPNHIHLITVPRAEESLVYSGDTILYSIPYSGDTILVLTNWAISCKFHAWQGWHGL